MYPFFHAVTHFELLDPENDGTVILRDVSNYVHVEIAQHPRRLESPATLQQELHISEFTAVLKVEFYKAFNMSLIKYLLLTCSVTLTVY